jgi:hypothetical protein
MVTLGKTGMIGLNAAVSRNLIGDNRFAHLYFDKDKKLIGIKFQKSNDQDAYPVKCSKNMGHGSIAGVSFLKTYSIFPDQTTAYPAIFLNDQSMLVIDLSHEDRPKTEIKKGKRQ